MINIESFRQWQQEGNRSVKIEMGSFNNRKTLDVWVYDYDLNMGQHVNSVDEIDIEKVKKEQLEYVLKELKALSKNEPLDVRKLVEES